MLFRLCVIVALSTAVFESAADPVTSGLVTSLSRLGGNVTGVSLMGSAKRMELLHELAPKASSVASLLNPNYAAAKSQSDRLAEYRAG